MSGKPYIFGCGVGRNRVVLKHTVVSSTNERRQLNKMLSLSQPTRRILFCRRPLQRPSLTQAMSQAVCLLVMAGATYAQFALDGVRCGQLTCQVEEYCSQDTQRCAPCSVACNHTSHNYDSGLCNKECLAYLLDLRYMRKTESSGSSPDISGAQRQAQAALIVSGVALAVLVLVLAIVCRGTFSWKFLKQKFQPTKNRVKQYPSEIHQNPHAEMPKSKHELKLEIRNHDPPRRTNQPLNVRDLDARTSQTEKSLGATTPKTISTALSNRHPAEDTTLDFSYDNIGMNVTPPEQPAAASHRF